MINFIHRKWVALLQLPVLLYLSILIRELLRQKLVALRIANDNCAIVLLPISILISVHPKILPTRDIPIKVHRDDVTTTSLFDFSHSRSVSKQGV